MVADMEELGGIEMDSLIEIRGASDAISSGQVFEACLYMESHNQASRICHALHKKRLIDRVDGDGKVTYRINAHGISYLDDVAASSALPGVVNKSALPSQWLAGQIQPDRYSSSRVRICRY